MDFPSNAPTCLRAIIPGILRNPQGRRDLNDLIALCHSLAIVCLRRKITLATLHQRFHYSSFSDLAYDSIADLFRRDRWGSMVGLKAYFSTIDHRNMSDGELLLHVKRLVCCSVNQSISRAYSEADQTLGKILRNIRLALHTSRNLVLIERGGEPCIFVKACSPLEQLPQVDAEELETSLQRVFKGREHTPELLEEFSVYLRKQSTHSRLVPLMTLALAVRSLYGSPPKDMCASAAVEELETSDTLTIVKCACDYVRMKTREKYLKRKKLDSRQFELYLQVVMQNISARLRGSDGTSSSLYHHLMDFFPEMNRQEYGRVHRSTIEYLTHLTWKRAGELLREST